MLPLNHVMQREVQNEKFLSIGTMSGTSMDGIDVALIETDGNYKVREIAHTFLEYDKEFHLLLKSAEYAVHKNNGNIKAIKQEDYRLYFKEYITKILGMSAEDALKEWDKVLLAIFLIATLSPLVLYLCRI